MRVELTQDAYFDYGAWVTAIEILDVHISLFWPNSSWLEFAAKAPPVFYNAVVHVLSRRYPSPLRRAPSTQWRRP